MSTDDEPLKFAHHPSAESLAEFEAAVLEEIPLPLTHVPDADDERYDAILDETTAFSQSVQVLGRLAVPGDTPIELKTCQAWIDDRHSWSGRRRGRWKIDRDAHQELRLIDGWYILCVREPGQVLEWILAPAGLLDPHLKWTHNGDGEEREQSDQVSWGAVIDPDSVASDGGGAGSRYDHGDGPVGGGDAE